MPETLPFIYNPAAGPIGRSRAERAMRCLEKGGIRVEPLATTCEGYATKLAAEAAARGAPRLIVAGGDGTINEVINGIAGTGTELAIIPAGTANVLAIELGIPSNIELACRTAAAAPSVRIDLGRVNGRYFALMAGIGFDAMVIKNLNPVLKKTIRHAAYPLSGLKTFFGRELPPVRISGPEHESEGYLVIAANSRYYGGRFGPTPEASMTDGLLDICVLREKGFQKMVGFWYGALKAGRLEGDWVEYFRTREIDVACPTGAQVLVQTDGEVVGELPAHITIEPLALDVCVGAGR